MRTRMSVRPDCGLIAEEYQADFCKSKPINIWRPIYAKLSELVFKKAEVRGDRNVVIGGV